MANRFDGPLVLDEGTGTPAIPPTGYFVFGAVTTGARLYFGAGDPDGTLAAPKGSIWVDIDTPAINQNEAGATGWSVVTQST